MRFIVATLITALAMACGTAKQQTPKSTITIEKCGFTVSYPPNWSAKRISESDPLPDVEEFKSGRATIGFSATSGESPDSNAVLFNQTQPPPPVLPTVLVYAHEKKPQTFEEFSQMLAEYLQIFSKGQMRIDSSRKIRVSGLEGYDFTYGEGPMKTRLVVFFHNGRRYGLTYGDFGTGTFYRNTKTFDEFVQSFRVTK